MCSDIALGNFIGTGCNQRGAFASSPRALVPYATNLLTRRGGGKRGKREESPDFVSDRLDIRLRPTLLPPISPHLSSLSGVDGGRERERGRLPALKQFICVHCRIKADSPAEPAGSTWVPGNQRVRILPSWRTKILFTLPEDGSSSLRYSVPQPRMVNILGGEKRAICVFRLLSLRRSLPRDLFSPVSF